MGWMFLSTHGLVLVALAHNPQQTMRYLAETVGVTERTVQSVVRDLVDGGYVIRIRVGRRNVYRLDATRPMRHPENARHDVAALLQALE